MPPPAAPALPQTQGDLAVPGLTARVSVVRDRWGIPHITAANTDDLFFAQGFVQAQDRLFQMDLWRRAAQGRLSETLGANFIERDAMTRRFQFRGREDEEWAKYGPDARRIATAFTRGVNAWVAIALTNLPEEFRLAGWQPETWKAEDLLNRTDPFVASGNATDDLLRARLAAVIGVDAVDRLWPAADGRKVVIAPGVDLSAVSFIVSDTVRRMGTPAFFSALAARVSAAPRGSVAADMVEPPEPSRTERPRIGQETASRGGDLSLAAPPSDEARVAAEFRLPDHYGSQAWAVAPSRAATGAPLLAVSEAGRPDAPASRYLVHLTAPGLNLIGATAPWMPGVAVGHNGHIAWGTVVAGFDTQDVFVERVNPADPHQVERDGRWVAMSVEPERIAVKGRATPFQIDRLYTSNGVVVGLDRERHLAYALRWSGTEPGGSELAALAVNRATTWDEFREAAARWTAPAVTFVYADVDGHIAQVQGGAAPTRGQAPAANGLLPLPGWSSAHGWRGTAPAASGNGVQLDPRAGFALALNGHASRTARVQELLSAPGERTPAEVRASLVDTVAPNARTILPLLLGLRDVPSDAERILTELRSWDGTASAASTAALRFEALEREIAVRLARARVPAEFVEEIAARIDVGEVMAHPAATWFDGNVTAARDRVLVEALTALAAADTPQPPTITFTHPLAVFEAAKRRFNVGPLPRPGAPHALLSTTVRAAQAFRAVFDVSDWSRSMAALAPGQSGSPASAHYDDLATPWASGEFLPLAYSAPDVKAVAVETLTLTPR